MKIAVFAGTFDPVTKGHEYVVNKSLESFDKVYVVVADNVDKTPLFSIDERLNFLKNTFENDDRVEVFVHHGLMMDFMKEKGLTHYVRGIRNTSDLSYEKKMLDFNKSIYPNLSTVFIYSPDKFQKFSSSLVRGTTDTKVIKEAVPSVIFDQVVEGLLKK